jgi:rhodanese-related sulfurtransferase
MKNILATEAWELLSTVPNSFLVDVRRQSEWDTVGFPDLTSINKNLIKITWQKDENDFLISLKEILQDKDAHVIFICKAGGRSAAAATAAINGGYENCYNVLDGFEMNGWKDNNLPYVIS